MSSVYRSESSSHCAYRSGDAEAKDGKVGRYVGEGEHRKGATTAEKGGRDRELFQSLLQPVSPLPTFSVSTLTVLLSYTSCSAGSLWALRSDLPCCSVLGRAGLCFPQEGTIV